MLTRVKELPELPELPAVGGLITLPGVPRDSMKFCRKCRGVLTEAEDAWACDSCGWELQKATGRSQQATTDPPSGSGGGTDTALESLPTTDSGAIRKAKALEWMRSLESPSDDELLRSVTAKPKEFSGSTFASDVSNVRVTGDAEFIEAFAGLLEPFLELESERTRLEVNLQRTEDRDSGELTDNYALYLSVAER